MGRLMIDVGTKEEPKEIDVMDYLGEDDLVEYLEGEGYQIDHEEDENFTLPGEVRVNFGLDLKDRELEEVITELHQRHGYRLLDLLRLWLNRPNLLNMVTPAEAVAYGKGGAS